MGEDFFSARIGLAGWYSPDYQPPFQDCEVACLIIHNLLWQMPQCFTSRVNSARSNLCSLPTRNKKSSILQLLSSIKAYAVLNERAIARIRYTVILAEVEEKRMRMVVAGNPYSSRTGQWEAAFLCTLQRARIEEKFRLELN